LLEGETRTVAFLQTQRIDFKKRIAELGEAKREPCAFCSARAVQLVTLRKENRELKAWKEEATGELIEAGKGLGKTAESLLEAQATLKQKEKRISDLEIVLGAVTGQLECIIPPIEKLIKNTLKTPTDKREEE